MLTILDLRRKAERYFGEYLSGLAHGREDALFPWRIPGTRPTTPEALGKLLQTEMPLLKAHAQPQRPGGYLLETQSTNFSTGSFGQQTWPCGVVFRSAAELLVFLGKERQRQARHFEAIVAWLRGQLPELSADWMVRQQKFMLDYSLVDWQDLTRVCRYFLAASAEPGEPGLYVRELPIAVHTKFIEEHEAVLTSLLRQLAPAAFNAAGKTFAARLRLREPEPLVHVRILDPLLSAGLSFGLSEFLVPRSKFHQLNPPGHTVLIAENKITFLTLPALAGTVAVWGQGFAINLVEHAAWLATKQLIYWGDLDTAGLQILNRLRSYCPATETLLMDATTLQQYRAFHVKTSESVTTQPLQHLLPAEQALFDYLASNAIRLEQERIPQVAVLAALKAAYPHLFTDTDSRSSPVATN